MSEWLFWLILLAVGLFLWWLAYYATRRMYIKKREARKAKSERDAGLPQAGKDMNMEEH